MAMVRRLVSKKKRRFTEDGFDLDLSFITDNIVAMGFPSENIEGLYRNNLKDVRRFFDSRCKDHYKIYNLCSEKEYDASKFYGRVVRFGFEDHNAPPFLLIEACCKDIEIYLKEDPKNVAVIHCKAGKGRTGVIICAYMLHVKQFAQTQESLDFYAEKRTYNKKGVTIPSQIRYVHYYGQYLRDGRPYEPTPLKLAALRFNGMPSFAQGTCVPHLVIKRGEDKVVVHKTAVMEGLTRDQKEVVFTFEPELPLCGDFRVECYHGKSGKEKMLFFWFNTFFVREPTLRLTKPELDKANKDKKDKLFPADFSVSLAFVRPSPEEAAATSLAAASLRATESKTELDTSADPDADLTDDDDDDSREP